MVVAVEEDSTAAVAADFMAAGLRFTEVEVSAAESTLGLSADAHTAAIMAATTEGGATTADITAVTDGEAEVTAGVGVIGAADTVTAGADGESASAGRIGVGDMDIPMAITTAPGITGLDLIILTRPTVLRGIPRALRIKATGTAILNRQIPTHGHSLTRTDPQDTGPHRHRETYSVRTTEALPRRVREFSPLTG
jgi:hypothetical protein